MGRRRSPASPARPGRSCRPGSYGEFIGKVVLTFDPASGEVIAHTQQNVPRLVAPVTGNTPAQNEAAFAAQLVATYPRVAQVNTIVDRGARLRERGRLGPGRARSRPTSRPPSPAARTDRRATRHRRPRRDDRASESTLGDLVANALRDTLAPENLGGAEIGVVNPGGLRAELLYAPDGVVTTAEANGVLPFVNNLWTTSLTGAQFKTMLEQQWQTLADGTVPTRPYLQLGPVGQRDVHVRRRRAARGRTSRRSR